MFFIFISIIYVSFFFIKCDFKKKIAKTKQYGLELQIAEFRLRSTVSLWLTSVHH